jgi:hypothetical protein
MDWSHRHASTKGISPWEPCSWDIDLLCQAHQAHWECTPFPCHKTMSIVHGLPSKSLIIFPMERVVFVGMSIERHHGKDGNLWESCFDQIKASTMVQHGRFHPGRWSAMLSTKYCSWATNDRYSVGGSLRYHGAIKPLLHQSSLSVCA